MRALRWNVVALMLICEAHTGISSLTDWSDTSVPPLFNITATSLYEAGREHGRVAAARIKGWMYSPEMQRMIGFSRGSGLSAFEQLKRDNTALYPQYIDELRGIADGAGVPVDSIWALTMISELESLMGVTPFGHCSDIYAADSGAFCHGHNEDWVGPIQKYWYFVSYKAAAGANFQSCAGLVYPGALVGWASSWNAHGMYLTQNSLFPVKTTAGGAAAVFAQRDALCGGGAWTSPQKFVEQLTMHRWSSGASVNLVDSSSGYMANIEVYEDKHSVWEVYNGTSVTANYSHFNMYKNLEPGKLDQPEPSTVHRQARADALPAPRNRQDVMKILSDTGDEELPIYRKETLTTMVLDGTTARMDVWCCGHSAANGTLPVYTWDLHNFFRDGSTNHFGEEVIYF